MVHRNRCFTVLKHGGSFHGYVSHNQRVHLIVPLSLYRPIEGLDFCEPYPIWPMYVYIYISLYIYIYIIIYIYLYIPYAPCMVYVSYIWVIFKAHVGKYSIHGASGYVYNYNIYIYIYIKKHTLYMLI